MNDRDINHLHPDLQQLCRKFLARCQAQNIATIIIYTWRSISEQDALYAQGRMTPGKIVTNAKGGQSKHNFTVDGKPASKAFDFTIKNRDGTLNWNIDSREWKSAIAIGKELGLVWGGDFRKMRDADHFEIP